MKFPTSTELLVKEIQTKNPAIHQYVFRETRKYLPSLTAKYEKIRDSVDRRGITKSTATKIRAIAIALHTVLAQATLRDYWTFDGRIPPLRTLVRSHSYMGFEAERKAIFEKAYAQFDYRPAPAVDYFIDYLDSIVYQIYRLAHLVEYTYRYRT